MVKVYSFAANAARAWPVPSLPDTAMALYSLGFGLVGSLPFSCPAVSAPLRPPIALLISGGLASRDSQGGGLGSDPQVGIGVNGSGQGGGRGGGLPAASRSQRSIAYPRSKGP